MTFWTKVKKDLRKEINAGVAAVKEGAAFVREKAEEVTEEGKRQFKIFELKRKVHDWIADLGGKVYELNSLGKNPMNDTAVKLILSRIKKLEAQIEKLEGKAKIMTRKAPVFSARSRRDSMPNNKPRK